MAYQGMVKSYSLTHWLVKYTYVSFTVEGKWRACINFSGSSLRARPCYKPVFAASEAPPPAIGRVKF